MEVSDNFVTGLMAHQTGRKAGYHLPSPALTQLKMPVVSSTARAQDQLTLSFKAGNTRVFLEESSQPISLPGTHPPLGRTCHLSLLNYTKFPGNPLQPAEVPLQGSRALQLEVICKLHVTVLHPFFQGMDGGAQQRMPLHKPRGTTSITSLQVDYKT